MKPERLSNEEFKRIFSRVPRLCVDLIIKDSSGAILLTKRAIKPSLGKWHLPGGGVKFRETLNNAVKRIAKQELGVNAGPIKLLGFMEFLKEDSGKRHSTSLVFLTKIKSGKIIIDNQSTDFRFFRKLPGGMIPQHKKFILKTMPAPNSNL